jgi:hypothetical protein
MAGELMSAELSEPPGDLAAQFAKCDCKALIEAIWHSQHHLALHDSEERLLAWSAAYEAYHQQVFDALRAEGRVAEVRFPEFARRSLIGKTPPERIADEAAARVAAHRDPDGISIDRGGVADIVDAALFEQVVSQSGSISGTEDSSRSV